MANTSRLDEQDPPLTRDEAADVQRILDAFRPTDIGDQGDGIPERRRVHRPTIVQLK